jgi:hypothetical protein
MSTLLEQASLVLIPSGYKEDTVYSVIPSNGSGDMSFTRASDGTRINSDGLVEVTPWNILQYSEDFTNIWWSKIASTISSNATTAPNGTLTADKLIESATNTVHYVTRTNAEFIAGTTYTLSFYAKASERTWLAIAYNNESNRVAWFNLTTGVVGTVQANITATSIESVGNGWYRCSITSTTASTQPYPSACVTNANGVISYTGDGTSGIFIWGAQMVIGSTAKPYFPTTDRLNVPRLTYQNGGGGCPSLLLEPQRTNLFTYSEDFTIWTKGQYLATLPTVTADYGISPSGIQNADRVQMTRPSGASYVEISKQSFITVGTVISFSVFIKSLIGTTKMTIGALGSTNTINLTNDWVRYTYTMTTTNNPTTFSIGIIGSQVDSLTADFLVWGAQVEVGAYASSYIPTTSASATRIADACFKTGISSLIGQTEGVLFTDFICNGFQDNGTALSVNNGLGSQFIIIRILSNGNIRGWLYNGSTQAEITYTGGVVGQRYKLAFAYKTNDFAMYVNGSLVGTDVSGATFSGTTLSRVDFDSANNASYILSLIKVNQAILFKTRLTNSELALITTI